MYRLAVIPGVDHVSPDEGIALIALIAQSTNLFISKPSNTAINAKLKSECAI